MHGRYVAEGGRGLMRGEFWFGLRAVGDPLAAQLRQVLLGGGVRDVEGVGDLLDGDGDGRRSGGAISSVAHDGQADRDRGPFAFQGGVFSGRVAVGRRVRLMGQVRCPAPRSRGRWRRSRCVGVSADAGAEVSRAGRQPCAGLGCAGQGCSSGAAGGHDRPGRQARCCWSQRRGWGWGWGRTSGSGSRGRAPGRDRATRSWAPRWAGGRRPGRNPPPRGVGLGATATQPVASRTT